LTQAIISTNATIAMTICRESENFSRSSEIPRLASSTAKRQPRRASRSERFLLRPSLSERIRSKTGSSRARTCALVTPRSGRPRIRSHVTLWPLQR